MAVDARSRRSLYDLLKEPLGMDATNALLDELPPLGADLATKDDIEDVKADINRLRTATAADIEGVRADIDRLRTATAADINRLRMETTGHIARLDQRIEERATLTEERLGRQLAEVKASLSAQNVRMMLGMLGLIVALVISLVMLR